MAISIGRPRKRFDSPEAGDGFGKLAPRASRTPQHDKPVSSPFEKKVYAKPPFDKKPYEKKSFEKKPFEKKVFEKQPFGKKVFDGKSTRKPRP